MTPQQKNNELIDRALHMSDVYIMVGDTIKALEYTQLAFWLCKRNFERMQMDIKKSIK